MPRALCSRFTTRSPDRGAPRGVSIAVTDLGGDGPVVVLLHGLAGSSRALLPTANALRGYRVVLVDHTGARREHAAS